MLIPNHAPVWLPEPQISFVYYSQQQKEDEAGIISPLKEIFYKYIKIFLINDYVYWEIYYQLRDTEECI